MLCDSFLPWTVSAEELCFSLENTESVTHMCTNVSVLLWQTVVFLYVYEPGVSLFYIYVWCKACADFKSNSHHTHAEFVS